MLEKPNKIKTAGQFNANKEDTEKANFFNEWALPPPPTIFRYIDDFSKTKKTVRFTETIWKFRIDGKSVPIDWHSFPDNHQGLLKRFIVWCVTKYDASTVLHFVQMFRTYPEFIISFVDAFANSIDEAKENWEGKLISGLSRHKAMVARAFATFLSSQSLCGWTNDDAEFLKSWNWYGVLKDPSNSTEVEKFRLSSSTEVLIITYLETVATNCIREGEYIPHENVVNAALLYWIYQHGFRPGQLAVLDIQDLTVISAKNDRPARVHATFYRAKQRSVKTRFPMRRKMKPEWASIMLAVIHNRSLSHKKFERKDSLFGMTPNEIGLAIRKLTLEITGKKSPLQTYGTMRLKG